MCKIEIDFAKNIMTIKRDPNENQHSYNLALIVNYEKNGNIISIFFIKTESIIRFKDKHNFTMPHL